MRVLVTGGAGYIGSVTTEALLARGHIVAVLDNLSTGHREAVFDDCTFVECDILDRDKVSRTLSDFRPEAVVHFAALSVVGESVADPARYMHNNVAGTLSLLDAMRDAGCAQIVFSSTAAVYGCPASVPISESFPTSPANPYGWTKLFMEEAMRAYGPAYGLRSVCLRYFNAAGATRCRGEHHEPETHLIPVVLQVAMGRRKQVAIFGTDYDTPDGTCVRDYIHVEDLAEAHLRAIDYLASGGSTVACNLGNGQGYSVREVVTTCSCVTGVDVPVVETERRPGDPDRLVADASLAASLLGWKPRKPGLETIVADAWAWHRDHHDGYRPST